MKGKKGFLFTFITIFLLFSLLVLSYDYLKRNRTNQEFIAGLTHSNRINFLKEDVVSNYYTLLDIDLEGIERSGSYIILKFKNFSMIKSGSTYQTYLDDLESYVEVDYSNMSNVKIDLENFYPQFTFEPYNTTFVIDEVNNPSELFIYMNDQARFQRMTIDIKLNVTNASRRGSIQYPSADAPSNPVIWVRVYDKNNVLMMNSSLTLSSTQKNEDYTIQFNKIVSSIVLPTYTINTYQNLTFNYGRYNTTDIYGKKVKTDATFHLKATGLDASITRLHLNYTLTGKKAVLKTKGQMYLR